MSTEKRKVKVIGVELDTERVEHIKQLCRIHNLNPKKVINVLYQKHKISRFITDTVSFDDGVLLSLLETASNRREEEIQLVKNLIEQCLLHFMSQKEVMDILYEKENIEPSLTKTVLQHLIDQNQEFFKNYYFWVAVKHQSTNFKLNAPAAALEVDRHRLGILGLKLQVPPATTPALRLRPPTDN